MSTIRQRSRARGIARKTEKKRTSLKKASARATKRTKKITTPTAAGKAAIQRKQREARLAARPLAVAPGKAPEGEVFEPRFTGRRAAERRAEQQKKERAAALLKKPEIFPKTPAGEAAKARLTEQAEGVEPKVKRREAGAPLVSPKAGAMGRPEMTGITPETFAPREGARALRPLAERLKEEEERKSRELQKYKEQLTEQEYRKISKDVEAGSKKRQEEIRQQYDDEYKDWLAQNEELKAKMLSDQMKQEKPQVFTGIDPQIQTQAENMSLKIQSLIDSIEDPDIQSAMQMLAGLTENKETNLATLELMQKQTSLQESQEASESYAEGAAERFNRYLDKAEQVAAISRERNEKYLSQQEAQAKARLDFQEKKAERSLKKAQSRALDARAARLALSGGFGSPGGLAEIDRMDFEYEQALSDLYTEVGLKRADLTIQFSGLYNEVQEQYQVSVLNAMRDHTNAMAALELQSFTNEEALRREQRNTITDFINRVVESRRETTGNTRDLIDDIYNAIGDEKEQTRKNQKEMWDNAMEVLDTFGTQNKELLGFWEEKLRDFGINIPSGALASTMTLDEREKLEKRKKLKETIGLDAGDKAIDWIEKTAQNLIQRFPHDSVEDILTKVAFMATQKFAGNSKANIAMRSTILDSVGARLGGDILTTQNLKKQIEELRSKSEIRERVLESDNPEGVLNDAFTALTEGSKAKFKDNPDRAAEFLISVFDSPSAATGEPIANISERGVFNWSRFNPMRILPNFMDDLPYISTEYKRFALEK